MVPLLNLRNYARLPKPSMAGFLQRMGVQASCIPSHRVQMSSLHLCALCMHTMTSRMQAACVRRFGNNCVYHGWTEAGDTLFCREGYLDSDAVLAHLNNVASCTGLADCTRLRRLELHGPPSQLAKLQGIGQQMGAECYERQEGFQRVALASAVNAEPLCGLHLDRTVLRDFCSIHAYYKVTNEEAVGRLLASFETRTRAEAGCLWYAWDRTDDRLFCNEAYANAEAVLAHVQHLEGVGSFGGAAQLTDIEFHGPAAELEKAMNSGNKF